jgi:NADPH:quinone reductase-like Zn-dependent oxidoreductase
MARRYRITVVVLALLGVTLASLALIASHDSPCGPAPALPGNAKLMKAVVHRCYGPPELLKLEDVERPTPADDEVLVRIRAASVNPLDFHYLRGTPYLVRTDSGFGKPKNPRLGVDFAGTVEAVGKDVKRFKPGDEVFGGKFGAFAEYVSLPEDKSLALKPSNMTFEQAAAVPIAAITALQALRDKGQVKPGQKVLVNGASGGVGTFAVQIAKAYGAEVTGVCSTRNVAMVKSIGADHVIDYTQEDYTSGAQRFDLIVDTVGNHSLSANRRVLEREGTLVIVGASESGNWIGPMARPIKALVLSRFVSQKLGMILAQMNTKDLDVLGDLMRAGKVTPVIDRRYKLGEVPEAIRYLETGHARGKVVIDLE